MTTSRLKLAAVLSMLLVSGCASYPPAQQRGGIYVPPQPSPTTPSPQVEQQPPPPMQPRVQQPQPAERMPAPANAAPIMPAAARQLAQQAERASQAGDHEAAAASLERALRIAPSNPVLWQNLAVVRYRQRDYAKVEGLAHKSNSLAGSNTALRAENWRLIAEVRRVRGDRGGADAAAAEARRLRSTAGVR